MAKAAMENAKSDRPAWDVRGLNELSQLQSNEESELKKR